MKRWKLRWCFVIGAVSVAVLVVLVVFVVGGKSSNDDVWETIPLEDVQARGDWANQVIVKSTDCRLGEAEDGSIPTEEECKWAEDNYPAAQNYALNQSVRCRKVERFLTGFVRDDFAAETERVESLLGTERTGEASLKVLREEVWPMMKGWGEVHLGACGASASEFSYLLTEFNREHVGIWSLCRGFAHADCGPQPASYAPRAATTETIDRVIGHTPLSDDR